MTLRSIQLSVVAFVLFICFFAIGLAPVGSEAAKPVASPTTWVFEGCWEQYQIGPCKDVYTDEQGNYWICKDCGTTGNPGPGSCSLTSLAALNRGFWCS